MPKIFPCRAVVCDARPEREPIQSRELARYPACTRPAIPVLAAAMYPPAKRTPGMPYNHGYSGGSVGPAAIQKKKERRVETTYV
jgi:hypothetical protein